MFKEKTTDEILKLIEETQNKISELENDKKTYTLNDLENKLINDFMNDEVSPNIYKGKVELLRVVLEKE